MRFSILSERNLKTSSLRRNVIAERQPHEEEEESKQVFEMAKPSPPGSSGDKI